MIDFATFIVEQGAASHAEVLAAIDEQRRSRPKIGRIALTTGMLTSADIFTVLAHQAKNRGQKFGEAAVELRLLKQQNVADLLLLQRKQATPLEQVLVEAGVIDANAAQTLRLAYSDLNPPSTARVPRPGSGTGSGGIPVKRAG